jgi:hypothetical protein
MVAIVARLLVVSQHGETHDINRGEAVCCVRLISVREAVFAGLHGAKTVPQCSVLLSSLSMIGVSRLAVHA